jgi:hypothetical protein
MKRVVNTALSVLAWESVTLEKLTQPDAASDLLPTHVVDDAVVSPEDSYKISMSTGVGFHIEEDKRTKRIIDGFLECHSSNDYIDETEKLLVCIPSFPFFSPHPITHSSLFPKNYRRRTFRVTRFPKCQRQSISSLPQPQNRPLVRDTSMISRCARWDQLAAFRVVLTETC